MDGLKKKNLQCYTIERTSDGFWKIKLLELVKNGCSDYANVCVDVVLSWVKTNTPLCIT